MSRSVGRPDTFFRSLGQTGGSHSGNAARGTRDAPENQKRVRFTAGRAFGIIQNQVRGLGRRSGPVVLRK